MFVPQAHALNYCAIVRMARALRAIFSFMRGLLTLLALELRSYRFFFAVWCASAEVDAGVGGQEAKELLHVGNAGAI